MKLKAAALVLFLCSVTAFADDVKVDQLLDVTGIAEQTGAFSGMIVSMYDQQKPSFSSNQYAELLGIITKSFAETEFEQAIRDEFILNYNDAYCEGVLARYKDPVFIQITEAEVAFDEADYAKVVQYDYSSVSAERDAIFSGYLEKSRMLAQSELVLRGSMLVFVDTFNLFLPAKSKIQNDMVEKIMVPLIASIYSDENKLQIKKRMALLYGSFSDAELEVYFNYYYTDEGKWIEMNYENGFRKGMDKAMKAAAEEIVARFNLNSEQV